MSKIHVGCLPVLITLSLLHTGAYMLHMLGTLNNQYSEISDDVSHAAPIDVMDTDTSTEEYDNVEEMYTIGDLQTYKVIKNDKEYILVKTPEGSQLVDINTFYGADEEEPPDE